MNEYKAIVGAVITFAGGVVAWLPVINMVVQLVAGVIAIAVGLATLRHLYYKDKRRREIEFEDRLRHYHRTRGPLIAKEESSTP